MEKILEIRCDHLAVYCRVSDYVDGEVKCLIFPYRPSEEGISKKDNFVFSPAEGVSGFYLENFIWDTPEFAFRNKKKLSVEEQESLRKLIEKHFVA